MACHGIVLKKKENRKNNTHEEQKKIRLPPDKGKGLSNEAEEENLRKCYASACPSPSPSPNPLLLLDICVFLGEG